MRSPFSGQEMAFNPVAFRTSCAIGLHMLTTGPVGPFKGHMTHATMGAVVTRGMAEETMENKPVEGLYGERERKNGLSSQEKSART